MQKIIILKGIPASGKSTWAKKVIAEDDSYVRINKDDLRISLGTGGNPCRNEKKVIAERDRIIVENIEGGKSVIVDDTNLNPWHEERIRDIARSLETILDKEIQVKVKWFSVSVDEAIKRDTQREACVGPLVIKRMYRQMKNLK